MVLQVRQAVPGMLLQSALTHHSMTPAASNPLAVSEARRSQALLAHTPGIGDDPTGTSPSLIKSSIKQTSYPRSPQFHSSERPSTLELGLFTGGAEGRRQIKPPPAAGRRAKQKAGPRRHPRFNRLHPVQGDAD